MELRIEMTHRAKIAAQSAEDKLKTKIQEVLAALQVGNNLPANVVARNSRARPGVRVLKIGDHRMFYRQESDVITVLDILPRDEAYK